MENIVIIGAGGVGREVALIIEEINKVQPTWKLLGFLDDKSALHNTYINGYRVLGGIDYIATMETLGTVHAVCAISAYKAKVKIVEKLKSCSISFPKIIHPSVQVSRFNSIGEGTIVYPGVIMTTNIDIGNQVIISPGSGIGHEAVIEDYCSVLWKVNISGNVRVGEGCLLGSGSTILQNISIGRESIVGAGAVVVKDLPERCTAVGVPARVVKVGEYAG
jgi:sugar O-acyltransferase (sialic acid O-acetyltransferase NeuD family)